MQASHAHLHAHAFACMDEAVRPHAAKKRCASTDLFLCHLSAAADRSMAMPTGSMVLSQILFF